MCSPRLGCFRWLGFRCFSLSRWGFYFSFYFGLNWHSRLTTLNRCNFRCCCFGCILWALLAITTTLTIIAWAARCFLLLVVISRCCLSLRLLIRALITLSVVIALCIAIAIVAWLRLFIRLVAIACIDWLITSRAIVIFLSASWAFILTLTLILRVAFVTAIVLRATSALTRALITAISRFSVIGFWL